MKNTINLLLILGLSVFLTACSLNNDTEEELNQTEEGETTEETNGFSESEEDRGFEIFGEEEDEERDTMQDGAEETDSMDTTSQTSETASQTWKTYVNDEYKYSFRYQDAANVKIQEFNNGACVRLTYQTGFVYFKAPNTDVKCETGELDYSNSNEKTDEAVVKGKLYVAGGNYYYEEDPNQVEAEIMNLELNDGMEIQYGSQIETEKGETFEDYLEDKKVLKQIISSLGDVK
jgi:hypothetical protein